MSQADLSELRLSVDDIIMKIFLVIIYYSLFYLTLSDLMPLDNNGPNDNTPLAQ